MLEKKNKIGNNFFEFKTCKTAGFYQYLSRPNANTPVGTKKKYSERIIYSH